jgi:hypothetical protein
VDIIKYSIIIFPTIFKTAMTERPNNLFCILLEAVLEFVFLSALVAKNIATKTPSAEADTKNSPRRIKEIA